MRNELVLDQLVGYCVDPTCSDLLYASIDYLAFASSKSIKTTRTLCRFALWMFLVQ